MKILQISTSDEGGGAESSALALFRGYRARGHRSWLAVGQKHSDDPDVFEIPHTRQWVPWAQPCWVVHGRLAPLENKVPGVRPLRGWLRLLAGGWTEIERRLGREDFNYPGTRQLLRLAPEYPDIVHAHNLHGAYFDLRFLVALSHQVPVILSLRDMWLLTGHCAYSMACERWRIGCGECPDLTIYPAIQRDATAFNWQRKRRIYAKSSLYITTPSQWLMDHVQQSMLRGVDHRVIPNGIDLNVFHPADQAQARVQLGLPQDSFIVLFAANGARRNVFKDYDTVEAAVKRVAWDNPDRSILFICLGDEGPQQVVARTRMMFAKFERDQERVALYYEASDVYVHAAKAEVFGKAITEALACGIPVVATSVGGIPEQIDDGITGFLVLPRHSAAMADRLERLLGDEGLCRSIGGRAAESARCRFGLNRQLDAFLRWYHEILINDPITRNPQS